MEGLARRIECGIVVGLIELAGIIVTHQARFLVPVENMAERSIYGSAIQVGKLGAQERQADGFVLATIGKREIGFFDLAAQCLRRRLFTRRRRLRYDLRLASDEVRYCRATPSQVLTQAYQQRAQRSVRG